LAPGAPSALKVSVRTLLTDIRAGLEAVRTKHAGELADWRFIFWGKPLTLAG
jgi:hypothetical protein